MCFFIRHVLLPFLEMNIILLLHRSLPFCSYPYIYLTSDLLTAQPADLLLPGPLHQTMREQFNLNPGKVNLRLMKSSDHQGANNTLY